ncbi:MULTISPECIES: RNA polymerase sigma factor [unclassified Oscillibacter]|uniref:RNA polymerase sigma factor n=1 Tax=unclassified Oscillibacter TaxID=2629304 RepID=UPI0025F7397B|nr:MULTISPECIES: sigma-70 family RNA polymerase sigma factor [unclassified Oscillibacter]
MNDIPEQQLVKDARAGDADAFETLVLRYEKRVYALALRMCGNPADAQEAAQEALLSAWQSLPFFRGESSFSTWLYRLTSNASVDLLRREKRQRAVSLDDGELSLNIPDDRLTPHEEAEQSELREAIHSGLKTLPDDYRAVLVLRELHQLSYQEISSALDVDLGTVKSRINRGRKRLCEFLTETGNFLPAAPSKNAEKEGR